MFFLNYKPKHKKRKWKFSSMLLICLPFKPWKIPSKDSQSICAYYKCTCGVFNPQEKDINYSMCSIYLMVWLQQKFFLQNLLNHNNGIFPAIWLGCYHHWIFFTAQLLTALKGKAENITYKSSYLSNECTLEVFTTTCVLIIQREKCCS